MNLRWQGWWYAAVPRGEENQENMSNAERIVDAIVENLWESMPIELWTFILIRRCTINARLTLIRSSP